MNKPRLFSLSLIAALSLASTVSAGWGWIPSLPRPGLPSLPKPAMPRMPNLNPFQRRDSHPANVGNQDSSWQWPGLQRKPAEPVAKPTMWQRASSGTKGAWTKTKATLTPWRSQPQPEEELVITGSNSTFSRLANQNARQPAKKAFWAWGNEEEDERPQKASSVSDFIGGRRPE